MSALQAATQSMRLVDKVDGVAYCQSRRTTRTARWSPSTEQEEQPGVVLIDPANGDVLADVEIDHAPGRGVWRSIRAAPSWPWPTAAPPVHPRSGVSRFPAAAPRGALLGTGRLLRAALVPPGRTLGRGGAVRTTTGGDERSSSGRSTPRTPRSRSGPGRRTGSSPAPRRWRSRAGDDQGSLSVVDLETGDVVRSIETPDIEVDRDRRRSDRATAWRCCRDRRAGRGPRSRRRRAGPRLRSSPARSRPSSAPTGGGWRSVAGTTSSTCSTPRTSPKRSWRDRRARSVRVSFAPDSSRLASISAGQLRFWELAPEGHPALGNFHASGNVAGARRRRRRVGGGGHHRECPTRR